MDSEVRIDVGGDIIQQEVLRKLLTDFDDLFFGKTRQNGLVYCVISEKKEGEGELPVGELRAQGFRHDIQKKTWELAGLAREDWSQHPEYYGKRIEQFEKKYFGYFPMALTSLGTETKILGLGFCVEDANVFWGQEAFDALMTVVLRAQNDYRVKWQEQLCR